MLIISLITVVFISSLIGLRRRNWLIVWRAIEFNTISICLMIIREKEENRATKYFIIQSIASAILIRTLFINRFTRSITILAIACIIVKIGLWPSHVWFIQLLENINEKTKSFLIIITWQKILPVCIIRIIIKYNPQEPRCILVIVVVIARLVATSLILKNNIKIKTVIILASIINSRWIVTRSLIRIEIFIIFLTAYSLSLIITINYLPRPKEGPKERRNIILSNIAAIPPTPFFWVKIFIIFMIIKYKTPFLVIITIILTSIFLCFFYFKTIATTHLIEFYNKKENIKKLWLIIVSRTILLIIICFI